MPQTGYPQLPLEYLILHAMCGHLSWQLLTCVGAHNLLSTESHLFTAVSTECFIYVCLSIKSKKTDCCLGCYALSAWGITLMLRKHTVIVFPCESYKNPVLTSMLQVEAYDKAAPLDTKPGAKLGHSWVSQWLTQFWGYIYSPKHSSRKFWGKYESASEIMLSPLQVHAVFSVIWLLMLSLFKFCLLYVSAQRFSIWFFNCFHHFSAFPLSVSSGQSKGTSFSSASG